MIVQVNTDKNVNGGEKTAAYYTDQINAELERFADKITRVELHLSDEDGPKSGFNTKRCVLEARVEHRSPIAVTSQADSFDQAISSALTKLVNALNTVMDKLQNK